MAFLGLVPGEHSSGSKRKLTGITKAGSTVARRLIVEAAWAYRMPAKIGQAMMLRQQSIATSIRDIAWRAQVRLCARYRRMLARGKKAPVVIAAVARELVSFIWAIGRQIEPKAAIAQPRRRNIRGGGQGVGAGQGILRQNEERRNRSPRVRPRQPYDECSACGIQSANEKLLNRRYHAGVLTSASLHTLTLAASRDGLIKRAKITCKRS